MKKLDKKPLAALVGATFVGTLSAGVVTAAENPFALKELNSGYNQVAAAETAKEKKETACGEGKCGAEMMKQHDMKCGAGMTGAKDDKAALKKATESKCAGMTTDKAPAQPPKAP
ncbi:hypothetical protein [Methylococcus sp. EFPC2]|uniref:HvfA family oxazolone/thioamide-modified RiPP metallophore n=1 Tax=Methylococcus sp. EFPC2 TaxID=2812648 RepID=UPI001968703B|nr:hypothetical protein [Methylococcus sp. EFPC2]QSA95975.1 hypothetical protein JWZ97_12085 [Methylococcus sp. EFPC2]